MSRHPDWQGRIDRLAQWHLLTDVDGTDVAQQFAFIAAGIEAVTGEAIAPTQEAIDAVLSDEPEVPPLQLQPGDFALLQIGEDAVLGVVQPGCVLIMWDYGVGPAPLACVIAGWRL